MTPTAPTTQSIRNVVPTNSAPYSGAWLTNSCCQGSAELVFWWRNGACSCIVGGKFIYRGQEEVASFRASDSIDANKNKDWGLQSYDQISLYFHNIICLYLFHMIRLYIYNIKCLYLSKKVPPNYADAE